VNWFHSHHWTVSGLSHLHRFHQTPRGEVRCPISVILRVCKCGELDTVELDGHWTMEQLRSDATTPQADWEFFHKLGIKV
jgi:hypothetical protein